MKYHVYTHLCATRLYLSFVLQNTYFPQNIFTIFYNKNSAIKVVKCLETLLCCVDYHGRKTRKFVYGDGSFFEKDLSDFLPMISKHTLAKSNDFCNHCRDFIGCISPVCIHLFCLHCMFQIPCLHCLF